MSGVAEGVAPPIGKTICVLAEVNRVNWQNSSCFRKNHS